MVPPTPFLGAAPCRARTCLLPPQGWAWGCLWGGAPAGPPGGRCIPSEATGVGPSPPASQGRTLEQIHVGARLAGTLGLGQGLLGPVCVWGGGVSLSQHSSFSSDFLPPEQARPPLTTELHPPGHILERTEG